MVLLGVYVPRGLNCYKGRFFEDRFKGIPVIDDESVLACAVYVDLNWIRACMAETLELSDCTSCQRRVAALNAETHPTGLNEEAEHRRRLLAASFLAPVDLRESSGQMGPQVSVCGVHCSDKGLLPMSRQEYLELLDWSARQTASGKRGRTPNDLPPIVRRLGLAPTVWLQLVANFYDLFTIMAGLPGHVDQERGRQSGRSFHVPKQTRKLFAQAA
jgi:hypothetical protein